MTVQVTFKKEFYEAVPHLFEETGEVQVEVCKPEDSKPDWTRLHKQNDGKAVFLILRLDEKNESQFHAFKECIESQGQQDSILCDEQGNVLDGYARWFALKALGVPDKNIKVGIVKGLGSVANKITWIRQRKLARHHLTEKQRMALVQAEIMAHPERSNNWQAKLLGVSYNTVAKYRKILEALGPKDGGIKWLPRLTTGPSGGTTSNKKPDEWGKGDKNADEQQVQSKSSPVNTKERDKLLTEVKKEFPGILMMPKSEPVLILTHMDEFFRQLTGMNLDGFSLQVKTLMKKLADDFSETYAKLCKALEQEKPSNTSKQSYVIRRDDKYVFHGSSPMAEAQQYLAMKHEGKDIPAIADEVGKDSLYVKDRLRLFQLPQEEQLQVHTGTLDPKKALKALLKRQQEKKEASVENSSSDSSPLPAHCQQKAAK
jgi:ParB-like chromosome segregation protein Spo0J